MGFFFEPGVAADGGQALQESPPTPSTPESLRAKIQAELERQVQGSESESGSADSDQSDAEEHESAEAEAQDAESEDSESSEGDSDRQTSKKHAAPPVRDPPSSVFDPTTVFMGPFALVKRIQAGVESYYVSCPLHSYKSEDGTTHRCGKAMQFNQPDQDTVVKRLRWWVFQGAPYSTRVSFGFLNSKPLESAASAPLKE